MRRRMPERMIDPQSRSRRLVDEHSGMITQRELARTDDQTQRFWDVPGIQIRDERSIVTKDGDILDFRGAGVTVTKENDVIVITITGGGGGGGAIIVQRGDTNVDTAAATIDFSTDFTATSSPAGEANIGIDWTNATLAEQIRDVIGTALVAGANVTITPSDGADTITIAASVGSHTHPSSDITDFAEAARDVIGTALVAGSGITVTVNDPGDTITIDASGGGGGLSHAQVMSRAALSL